MSGFKIEPQRHVHSTSRIWGRAEEIFAKAASRSETSGVRDLPALAGTTSEGVFLASDPDVVAATDPLEKPLKDD
jgi:hypothetical protein